MIDARLIRRQRRRNRLQSLLVLVGMVLIFAFIAWMFLGRTGLITVLVLGLIIWLLQPRVPTSWILRMYRAVPLPERNAPDLHRAIATLSQRAGLSEVPQLYYIPTPLANAFATGHGDDTAIGVTDGILRKLSQRQLVGVLAHEISHLRAGDTRIINLSDFLARMTHGLSYVGMVLVVLTLPIAFTGDFRPIIAGFSLTVLPTVTTLLQLQLSRSREYDADMAGASLTGDPEGLASALETLERSEGGIWERLMVPRQNSPDPSLWRSHPPTSKRAERLRALGRNTDISDGRALPGSNKIYPPDDYPPVSGPPRWRGPGIKW